MAKQTVAPILRCVIPPHRQEGFLALNEALHPACWFRGAPEAGGKRAAWRSARADTTAAAAKSSRTVTPDRLSEACAICCKTARPFRLSGYYRPASEGPGQGRVAVSRSLRRVWPGRDGEPSVRAAPPDARAAVRAAPPAAHAAAPCLRSVPVAVRQLLQEAAAPEEASGPGRAAVGFGMPPRAPTQTRSESV